MGWGFEDHCWQDVVSKEDIELYRHYERETYVGNRPALLVIDLYNMAYDGGSKPVYEVSKQYPSSCGENAWNAIEPTRQLLSMARARGFPVIYSTSETRPEARPNRTRATNRRSGTSGDSPFDIFEAFTPAGDYLIIYKQLASTFYGTPLVAHLTQAGIDSLLVVGESTSGCVRASVADAYSNGFHVTIAEECTYDRSMLSHKINLFDMHHKYADVMHFEEIAEHLERFPEI